MVGKRKHNKLNGNVHKLWLQFNAKKYLKFLFTRGNINTSCCHGN